MITAPAALQTEGTHVQSHDPWIEPGYEPSNAQLLYFEQHVPASGDKAPMTWTGSTYIIGEYYGRVAIEHRDNELIDGQRFNYNNLFSIGKLSAGPVLPEVRLEYAPEGSYSEHVGGGNNFNQFYTLHPMPWHPDQWYATAIKRWFLPGESVTHIAMFMYSYTDNQWTHYLSLSVPGNDLYFGYSYGYAYLTRYSGSALGYHGIYGQYFKMNIDGSWQKPGLYHCSSFEEPHTWKAELTPPGTNIVLNGGGHYENEEKMINLYPAQYDAKPKVVIMPWARITSAVYNPQIGALRVQWSVDRDKPPQLSYLIEVRRIAFGPVIISNSDTIPHRREAYFETGLLPAGTYYVTLHITDIFNQYPGSSSTMFEV